MPRRTGKAANRRAHQRPPKRPLQHVVTPPPDATPVPPVGTPDAREALSLDPPRRVIAPAAASAGSTLTTREQAEYHYVERDLRNIGVLVAVMALGLLVAWIVFSQLGLTR